MSWLVTDKGDQDVRVLADRHYTRQTPGSMQFCRNGQNLVLVTPALDAGWVTFRPTPGVATRADGLDAWECALFRNEGGGPRGEPADVVAFRDGRGGVTRQRFEAARAVPA